MPTIPQLFQACSGGNQQACRTLVELLWLGPIIARELKRLFGPVAIVPIPKPWPGPDPAPLVNANFLREGDLIRTALGDPNPQPNIVSPAEQLRGATELRSAMQRVIKALDLEIQRLKA